MLVAVEEIGKVIGGKFDSPVNQRITMKCIDKVNPYKKEFFGLNLDPTDQKRYETWMNYIKLGAVMEVTIKEFNKHLYVDKFTYPVVKGK